VLHEFDAGCLQLRTLDLAGRQIAAEILATLVQVFQFAGILRRLVEADLVDRLVGHAQTEAIAELDEILGLDFLRLMRDVFAFTGIAQAIALDGVSQDNGRLTAMLDRRFVGRVHLHRIVSAAFELGQLIVGEILDQFEQFGILAEEVFADISTALDRVLLELAIDDLAHALHEQAGLIAFQQRIPIAAPDDLDAIPARAAEGGFQFLNNFAIATHRTIETLQIAVDDPNEVVEFLARGQRDGTQRLRLIAFAVAEEGPDFLPRRFHQATVFEILTEARLIDAHDRPKPYRYGGELPEGRHQPRMRIRRQSAAVLQFPAKIVQLRFAQPALKESARVKAGRGVPLEIHQIRPLVVVRPLEEVVETDFIEGGRRGKGGDVSADAVGFLVGVNDHSHRVPANQAFDASFQFAVAGKERLARERDGVDVGSVGGEGDFDAAANGLVFKLAEQKLSALFAAGLQD